MHVKKVLVGLSGGVDSAVSAYLLKKEGYDVTAWFMINYLAPEWEVCPTKEDIEVAREVATFLDIPFFTFDYRDEYEEKVLSYMYEWYQKWITPNPDIMCNSEIKFKVFLDEALELWYDMVATGHYARIEEHLESSFKKNTSFIPSPEREGLGRGIKEEYALKKWHDPEKDQSYFLAWLSQEQLSKSLFPIGHLEKSQVREIAREVWLPNALRKDSQGICFVGKVDIKKFLEKKIQHKIWVVKDVNWKILWEHKWVFYYTIWQRKWLDIWWQKEPIFIVRKDIKNNEIIVWYWDDKEMYADTLIMDNVNFISPIAKSFPLDVYAKIRYRQSDQKCSVHKEENGQFKVIFKEKQRAIASGQICAIYLDDVLVMSGVIQ